MSNEGESKTSSGGHAARMFAALTIALPIVVAGPSCTGKALAGPAPVERMLVTEGRLKQDARYSYFFSFSRGKLPPGTRLEGGRARRGPDATTIVPQAEVVDLFIPAAGIVSDPALFYARVRSSEKIRLELGWVDRQGQDVPGSPLPRIERNSRGSFIDISEEVRRGTESGIAELRLRFLGVSQPFSIKAVTLVRDTSCLGSVEGMGMRRLVARKVTPNEELIWKPELPKSAILIFSTAYKPMREFRQVEGEFVYSIEAETPGSGRKEIFREAKPATTELKDHIWKDYKVDLSEYAGKDVTLRFRLFVSDPALREFRGDLLWGDPVVTGRRTNGPANVILIGIDTLRRDKLGAYGNPKGLTPNMDRLAEEGILFERMMSPSSWTLPSFASLYTSLYPSTHMAGYRHPDPSRSKNEDPEPTGLSDSALTLAEVLKANGYKTACYHENHFLSADFNMSQGFDDIRHQNRGDFSVARALTFAREHVGKRFFLFLHLMEPHKDYEPPPRHRDRLLPEELPKGEEGARIKAELLYEGEVAYADELVGRFLRGLDDFGLRENSLIVLTADHGEGFWEHHDFAKTYYVDKKVGYFGEGHGYNLFPETVDVPLIMRFPDRIDPGTRSRLRASLIDVAPTILDWVGLNLPSHYAGRSLREGSRWNEAREHDFAESFSRWGLLRQSYYEGDWKVIAQLKSNFVELYNVREDPFELKNLSEIETERARRMVGRLRTILQQARKQHEDLNLGAPPQPDLPEKTKKKLRALGYVD